MFLSFPETNRATTFATRVAAQALKKRPDYKEIFAAAQGFMPRDAQ
jgi:hypothetical protein